MFQSIIHTTLMKRPARISAKILILSALGAILIVLGALIAINFSWPKVQVTRLVEAPVVQAFYATGTIVPEREYPVKSQVAGVVFLEPGIDKGIEVKKGQLIGWVISDDLEKKKKQAQAELKEKTARADEKTSPVLREFDYRIAAFEEIYASAQREHQRLKTLSETGAAQQVEIDRAFDHLKTTWAELEGFKSQRQAKVLELARELEVAQANLAIAQWGIEQQELRSPIDGVILDWPVPTRTRVPINEHVLILADVRSDRLVMRAQVDEEDRNKLAIGQIVRMTLYSFAEDRFEGRVKTIYSKADAQRRTFEVDVEILRPQADRPKPEGDPVASAGAVMPDAIAKPPTSQPSPASRPSPFGRFAPGMTGELAFVEKEKPQAPILPRQALQGDSFWIVRDGKLVRIPAQAGVRNVTRVEVLGGIGPQDLVMLSPVGKMAEGDRVRTDLVDPRIAADLNKPKDTEIFKGGF